MTDDCCCCGFDDDVEVAVVLLFVAMGLIVCWFVGLLVCSCGVVLIVLL